MFFLILVVFLLIGGLVVLIAVLNLTPVQLGLFSLWHSPPLPLGVCLAAAFLFGAILLYLVSVLSAMGDRREIKTLREKVLSLQEQIAGMSATNSSSAQQTVDDGLSSADTGPMLPVPGVVNTPQPEGRLSTSPLSPLQNFRQ